MSRVALATSRFALPGAGTSLATHPDLDSPLQVAELERLGIEAALEVWDDAEVDWESSALVVVRSTWGYPASYVEFLAWAHARSALVNPYDVIEYSSDKHYLGDLATKGLPVIETGYCEVGDAPQLPEGAFVIKPAVGAGSIDAERYEAGDVQGALAHVARLHASGRCALIQPYVSSIDQYGERALVFLDGQFSHAMTKRAHLKVPAHQRDGDFRTRQMSSAHAEEGAIAVAREFLSGRFADLTYARVDLVDTPSGWRLMELELVEPALFLAHAEGAFERAARAIAGRLP